MRNKYVLSFLLASTAAHAEIDLRGSAGVEVRYFTHPQEFHSSVFIEPEWYWGENSSAWTIKAFARVDERDEERTHVDLREAFYLHANDDWELRAGINKVFWGVTESQHLIDVINQTDYLEGFDGEDKLGQPMVQFTLINPWGVIDTFMLPYFRERKFPGHEGRFNFSTTLPSDAEEQAFNANFKPARYESSQAEHHIDAALRYSHTLGNWDFGVSYFSGTRRDPLLEPTTIDTTAQTIAFTPYYVQMKQVGVDVQATLGAWLWKVETLSRWQEVGDYTAAVAGFEYTLYGITSQGADLGLLMELNWDERDKDATTALQKDVFVGGRLTWNDEQSSELLLGVIQDLDDSDSYMMKLETSRRLGNSYRLSAEAWVFNSDSPTNITYNIRNEDFLQLSLEKFF